jgi:pSer/pThr/pTyr-binding forkhead associated (FHA) protein
MADCEVKFDDNSLSRYHCMFVYENHWILQDGDSEKLSTNGTWLFAERPFDIFDGMTFKVGESLLKAYLTNELGNMNQI